MQIPQRRETQISETEQLAQCRRLKRPEAACCRHTVPKVRDQLPAAIRSPCRQPIRQDGGIDSPRARSNHCLHLEAAVFEQTIDHPPCKRAMGATSLQGELDLLSTCGDPGSSLCNMVCQLFS